MLISINDLAGLRTPGGASIRDSIDVTGYLLAVEQDARLMHRWLAPGGKVFVVAGTPYAANISGFLPEFERRARAGHPWPGECHEPEQYSDHPTIRELPQFIHLLDDNHLRAAYEGAGFEVECAVMYERPGLPGYLAFDGRENAALVARKP